ncbi:MAG TPA: fluoride efflux transporter CrcB [Xanthobacteraceae bacterium]|nr:fluoride efflux transporter CrcB [Xanthobacteraceae bacterium]
MTEFLSVLSVTLGCAFGGAARFFVSGVVARRVGETFPWGTLVVNATGAFAIGMLAASARAQGALADVHVWLAAVTGFLGSYTTVSSFSLQTLMLVRDGERARALGNIGLSVGLCVALAALGIRAGGALFGLP